MMREQLDLEALASGPIAESPISPRFGPQMQLETVVDALESYPGRGVDFVLASLASPSEHGRLSAVRALQRWEATQTPEIHAALLHARELEPDEEIRRLLDRAIAGLPWVQPEPKWPA